MKYIGFILISASFVGGSLVAVVDKVEVNWAYYAVALGAGVLGVIMARLGDKRETQHSGILSNNISALEASLTSIVKNITQMNQDKESIDTYQLHKQIDSTFTDDLLTFVDNRRALVYIHGMQSYADVMSCFAAGDRYLNRVWSASTDGYIDESHTYLDRSREQFQEALDKLKQHLTDK